MPATQVSYGPIPGQLLLLLLIVVAVGLFVRDAGRLYRLMRLGGPETRTDQVGRRTRAWLVHVLGQGRLLTRSYPGLMHALIFWGFLVITLGTIEQLGRGLFGPGFFVPFLSDSGLFAFLLDTFQL